MNELSNHSRQILNEIIHVYPKSEIINSIQLIRQDALQNFPNNGSIPELKRQQRILEHMEYFFDSYSGSDG